MTGVLLALLLLQVNPPPTGTVTGMVRSGDGKPAAGIRVYAVPAGDVNAVANNPVVFESLTQTDATGHYKLEVPVGRYTIAAGSVESPIYFPGTSDVTAAKIVPVVANTNVGNVDFPSFVPASSFPGFAMPPGSTGVLSGVVRLPNGGAAAGVTVALIPTSTLASAPGTQPSIFIDGPGNTSSMVMFGLGISSSANNSRVMINVQTAWAFRGTTDRAGRYRITGVSPGSYFILTGTASHPVFYPGTENQAAAMPVTTTASTNLDTLNILVPAPLAGASVGGKVSAITGVPAAEATVELQMAKSPNGGRLLAFLPVAPSRKIPVDGDGVFRFDNVPPGSYELTYRIPDISPVTRSVVVADQPVGNLDYAFLAVPFSGRITSGDGSPLPDLQSLSVAILEGWKASGQARVLNVSPDGRFSRLVENGEYRVYLRSLPQEYVVQSITAAGSELVRESLNLRGDSPVEVEIRLKRKTETHRSLSGKVIDAISGAPAAAERLQLCCFDSGPVERISSAIQSDGSFDFADVPQGRYTAELVGGGKLSILDPVVELGDQEISRMTLVSVSDFASVIVSSIVEGGGYQPSGMAVTFTGAGGIIRVTARTDSSGMLRVMIPAGERYSVTVSNIPDGYVLKWVTSDPPEVLNGILPSGTRADRNVVFITLTPATAR